MRGPDNPRSSFQLGLQVNPGYGSTGLMSGNRAIVEQDTRHRNRPAALANDFAGTNTNGRVGNPVWKAGLPDVRIHDLRHTFVALTDYPDTKTPCGLHALMRVFSRHFHPL
ncbi:hypothetical protein [Alkalilacustris brevis]|uniref:hypothetical protein n=1 Tax=Alkalilacustris brevis TaxID=2026338 RepID=UPI0012D2AEEE|nr:hypothetical protein [Alkalilacustris brevis]